MKQIKKCDRLRIRSAAVGLPNAVCTHRGRCWQSDGSAAQLIGPCRTGGIRVVLRVAGRSRRRSDRLAQEGEETDEGKGEEGEDCRGEDGG